MPDDPGNRDMESRLRDLQQLADEKLITSAEHEEHRRRLVAEAEDTQPLGTAVEPAPQEAMHGSAVALLDELIGLWSRWDLYAEQYLEEHAPRIVRSDDPDFQWIDQENERVVLTRLRALMSADEWRILPELIRARRSLALHELESDRDRPARLAAWTAAFESARREGRARLRREEEAVRARRSREAEAPAKRGPRGGLAGGRSGRDAAAADAEANPRRGPRPRPAGGRQRRSRRGGTRSVAESTATDPPASVEERLPRESVQVTGAEEAGARRPEAPTLESERAAESRMREDNLADETPLDPDGGESKPATRQPSRESRDAPVSHDLGGESVTRTTPQESGSPPSDPQRPSESLSDDADHTSGSTVVGSDPARSSSMPAGSDSNPVSSSPEVGAPSRPPRRDIVSGGPPGALKSELLGYARRLTRAGARSLADVVDAYARRVGAVEAGALPPSMSVAPSAVTPEMIGAALTRGRLEGLVEVFRNVLVFVPVLWTWLKLQSAVAAYEPGGNESFFDFWVRAGGSGPLGGTLGDAAIQVAAVLVVLIVVNVALGGLRRQNRQRAAHIGHDFTALLDRTEAAGAARRIADPQAALEGFVHASSGANGESALGRRVAPPVSRSARRVRGRRAASAA